MNRVVVIGTDHINSLGVIRCFGENGIKADVMIYDCEEKSSIEKSKYINEVVYFKKEDLVNVLIGKYNKCEKKPVVVCTTDFSAMIIDENYNLLKKYFILANVNDAQGKLVQYMDKMEQYNLAVKNDIKMAKSFVCNLEDSMVSCESDNIYPIPCILKPLISAKGSKEDIIICNSYDELREAFLELKLKKYSSVILQEYINYDSECDVAGFSFNKDVYIPAMILKKSIWPLKKGSTTYGEVKPVKEYSEQINKIKKLFADINYNGVFDVDFFVVNGELYLNEINFRNGAISYAYGNAYICFNWYKSLIEGKISKGEEIKSNYYFIDDLAHLHHVLDKNISIFKYLSNYRKSKIKLVKGKKDLKPFTSMFFKKLFKKKNRKEVC